MTGSFVFKKRGLSRDLATSLEVEANEDTEPKWQRKVTIVALTGRELMRDDEVPISTDG